MDGAEKVCLFDEVFCKVCSMAIRLECGLCSLNRAKKFLPVCLTYVLLQSGQVSLYTPDCVYLSVLSVICLLCISNPSMVLSVRSAIFRPVFLNKLVIKVVSLPP